MITNAIGTAHSLSRMLPERTGARSRSWVEACRRHPEVEIVAFVEPVELPEAGEAEE